MISALLLIQTATATANEQNNLPPGSSEDHQVLTTRPNFTQWEAAHPQAVANGTAEEQDQPPSARAATPATKPSPLVRNTFGTLTGLWVLGCTAYGLYNIAHASQTATPAPTNSTASSTGTSSNTEYVDAGFKLFFALSGGAGGTIATKISHNKYVRKLGEFLEEVGDVLEEVVDRVTGSTTEPISTATTAPNQPPLVPADPVITE